MREQQSAQSISQNLKLIIQDSSNHSGFEESSQFNLKSLSIKYNFLALDEEYSSYENSKIVIVSAPIEKTVSYGGGTKNGPKEILKASHYVEFFDEELDRELCFDKGICTLPIEDFSKTNIKNSIDQIYNLTDKLIKDEKFVVTIGGEHSLSVAPAQAHHENYENISILQFDAHSDLRDSYEGSIYSHASVMARIAEFNTNIVQVGIRAQCKEESIFIKKNNINTFFARKIRTNEYGENWQKSVLDCLNENVYITFDVDGFDPSFLAATGTPEPGGLFWDETMNLLKEVGQTKNIIGFDVVELAPNKNHPSSNFITAKLVYKILNYSFMNKN